MNQDEIRKLERKMFELRHHLNPDRSRFEIAVYEILETMTKILIEKSKN